MDYFEVRNIDPSTYKNHQIPPHLKHIILNLKPDAKILDFGCGFGQNLSAIHSLLQNSKGGGDKRY